MSTKCTIAHGDNFHFYRECLDDDHMYLEIEGTNFEAGYNRVMVPIPVHIWEVIRKTQGVRLDLVGLSEDQIKARSETFVDERLKEVAEADEKLKGAGRKSITRFFGSLQYGNADAPRDEQVKKGIESLLAEQKHQTEIKAAIDALEAENK